MHESFVHQTVQRHGRALGVRQQRFSVRPFEDGSAMKLSFTGETNQVAAALPQAFDPQLCRSHGHLRPNRGEGQIRFGRFERIRRSSVRNHGKPIRFGSGDGLKIERRCDHELFCVFVPIWRLAGKTRANRRE
jgi:hypothetical protein